MQSDFVCVTKDGKIEEPSKINGEVQSLSQHPSTNTADSWVTSAKNAANLTFSRISRASDNLRSFLDIPSTSKEKSVSKSHDVDDDPESPSVREKLNNAWLCLKYGKWNVKGRLKYDDVESKLWLLGWCYRINQSGDIDESSFQDFICDYSSRIWLTYRTELAPFPGTSKTTDCGWGCMIRTCQMIVAQTLTLLHLGREWRFQGNMEAGRLVNGVGHYDIVSLFGDSPRAELGLHRLMQIAGETYVNAVGSWYSPSMVLSLMREALKRANSKAAGHLRLHCVTDGMLVDTDVSEASDNFTSPVLIVVCVRLGARSINKCYYKHVLSFLKLRNTVGIVGGRPKHSVYFIGSYDKKSLIFLDPHVAHTAISEESLVASWRSFHCHDVSKMPLEDVDPSCAFGILVRNEEEYFRTVRTLNSKQIIDVDTDGEGMKRTADPIFSVFAKRPPHFEGTDESRNASLVAQAQAHGFELL